MKGRRSGEKCISVRNEFSACDFPSVEDYAGHFSLFSFYRNNIVFLMPIVSWGGTRREEVLSLEVLGTLAYACHTDLMLQQQINISSIFENMIPLSVRGVGLQFVCRGNLLC